MASDVTGKAEGPLWKPEKKRQPGREHENVVSWKKAPIPPGITRGQMKGETEQQYAARVKRQQLRGYRGDKAYAWRKVRDKFLKEQRLKEEPGNWWRCDTGHGYGCGRLTDAPEVDHIIKRSVRPDLLLEPSNFQVLCHTCHYKKDNGMKVA